MSELVASPCIEQQFHRIVQAIEQRLQLLDRLPRVRINAWLKKLKEEVSSNVIWQRNRNCYARLLLEQLRAGCLEVPFNTMPPEGALPTLPVYLTYRFLSPPKAQQASTLGSLDDRQCYSSSCLFGYDQSSCRPMRPLSAGAADSVYSSPTLRPLPASGAHDTWRVMWASTGPAGLSALAPGRGGSPPRQANIALQQQQQWLEGSPCGSRSGRPGSGRRGYASSSSAGSPQRPVSPGAAGLLDAAAVVAAELQAEQVEAERMNSRLRFAEDKLLQQEAELVRLQGAASAARRRIKTATAATLQELLDRYSSAAAVWQQGSSRTASPGSSVPPALADAVYKPVWQLLSGLQSVLDSCDQEEAEWLRAKGSAAAAAAAAIQTCYEAQAAGGMMPNPWALEQQQQQQLLSPMELGVQGTTQQQLKGAGQVAAEGAAAAAAEATVLQQCEGCLAALQQQAEVLAGELGVKKDEATTAAGGRGPLAAAAVAQATAKLLRPMLKLLKQEGKDASKLRRRLEAAAEASDAAAVAAAGTTAAAAEAVVQLQASLMQEDSDSSSGSSDSESESDASSSSSASSKRSSRRRVQRKLRKQQRVLQVAEQQQQLQGARLMRLQSASQLLMELDKAAAKLDSQLRDAQQRLLDMAALGGSAAAAANGVLLPLQHHDNGLTAAATAGIAASLSAGLRAFQANMTHLGRLVQSLRAGAAAATGGGGGGASPGSKAHRHRQHEQQQQRASGGGSNLSRSRSSPGRSVAAVTLPVGDAGGYFSRQNSSGGGGGGGGGGSSPGRLGRSISSRLGDAALAGTWGEQPAAGAQPAALPRSPKGSTYDAAAHYLIGAAAAAAAGAGGHGRSGGGASSVVGGRASLVSQQAVSASIGGGVVNNNSSSSPTTPKGLGPSKAAFTEHLQGSAGGAAAAAASAASAGGSLGGSGGGDAAAEAVHAQLAGLSRQASRLSVRASQLVTAGSAADSAAAGGSSAGTAAAAAAAAGLLSTGSTALRTLTGSSSFSALQRATGATLGASSSNTAAAALSARPLTAGLGAFGGGAGLSGAAATLQGSAGKTTGLSFSSLAGASLSGGAAAGGGGSLLSSATRAALLGPGGGVTGSTAGLGVAAGFASSVGSLNANRSPLLLRSGALSAGGGAGGGGGSSISTAFGPGGALSVPLLRANAISSKLGLVSNGGSLAAISSRLQSLTGGR